MISKKKERWDMVRDFKKMASAEDWGNALASRSVVVTQVYYLKPKRVHYIFNYMKIKEEKGKFSLFFDMSF